MSCMKPSGCCRIACGVFTLAALCAAEAPARAQPIPQPVLPAAPAAPQPTSDSPKHDGIIFADVLGHSLRDFRNLPSADTLTWLSLGSAVALAGSAFDAPTSRTLSGSVALDAPFEAGEIIGGATFQLAGSMATYAVGRLTGNHTAAAVGAELLRAQILTQSVNTAIKAAVRRTRPDGTRYSFPSGHSSVTFASATVLQQRWGWKVGVPAYAVATYVATSRIQEKRHFLSDVAFGAALGIAAGRTVTLGSGRQRFALGPMATPSGAGLSLTWLGQP
jgi:membrane-associated phospholipid phosphatase